MLESADFQTLFSQLQSRYPTSSLTSELVQIHAGHYVVRAVVQVGGIALATSMAAAATVELAEDQARLRVLRMLGIHAVGFAGQGIHAAENGIPSERSDSFPNPASSLSGSLQTASFNDTLPPSLPPLDKIFHSSSDAPLPLESPLISEPASTGTSFTPALDAPALDAPALDAPALDAPALEAPALGFFEQEPEQAAVGSNSSLPAPPSMPETVESVDDRPAPETSPRPSKSRKTVAVQNSPPPELPAPSVHEPLDLTPLFLQIEDEMDRIGWTKEQGRNHLKQAYNKRSRQQLTDEELMDFLAHLKTQPAGGEASSVEGMERSSSGMP
ncbi:MAG: hypothetical protein WCA35_07065 [Kovacikia sp.]